METKQFFTVFVFMVLLYFTVMTVRRGNDEAEKNLEKKFNEFASKGASKVEHAKTDLEDATEKLKHRASKDAEFLKEKADEKKQEAKGAWETAKEKTAGLFGNAKEKAAETKKTVTENANEAKEKAKSVGSDIRDNVKQNTKLGKDYL